MKNIDEFLSGIKEFCSPKVISKVNDHYLKLAKVIGKLPLHKHKSDELFVIVNGSMDMEVEGKIYPLKEGDVFLVEKHKMHRPIAKEQCDCLLFEKKDLLHTGDQVFDITKTIDEQL